MRTALLLVGHGTPEAVDQIPEFLSNIRRGRPTSPEVVEEVRRRYQAIGGHSPMLDTTRRQAELLSARVGLPCYVAMRMWHPRLGDVLQASSRDGIERLLVIVMAPHSASVYETALREAAVELTREGVRVPEIMAAPSIGCEPTLVDTFASLVRQELESIDPTDRARAVLVPSAHSLPLQTIRAGDPYPGLVEQTAQSVVQRLGKDALPSLLSFQSQGMSGGEWLGPDLPSVFRRALDTGATGVVVAPIGFLVDHVETLYDLDIEAKAKAAQMGLWFRRTPCPNASEGMIHTLEAVARRLMSAAAS